MEWYFLIVIAACIFGVGIIVVLIYDMYDYYHRYLELQREYRDLLIERIRKTENDLSILKLLCSGTKIKNNAQIRDKDYKTDHKYSSHLK
jgi:isochorismate hydrolase